MSWLVVDVRDDDGAWRRGVVVDSDAEPGSLSHTDAGGHRHLYRLQCGRGSSVIDRCVGGVDTELAERVMVDAAGQLHASRLVSTTGFELVALLVDGASYEMDVRTDVSQATRRIRVTHFDRDPR